MTVAVVMEYCVRGQVRVGQTATYKDKPNNNNWCRQNATGKTAR